MATKIAELYAELKLIKGQFSTELKSATNDIAKFKGEIQGIATASALMGAAITGAFTKITYDFVKYTSEIDRLNKITGISTDTIQKLGYAAEQEHSSMQDLAISLRFLSRSMEDAKQKGGEIAEQFKSIGINFSEVANQTLTVEDIFFKLNETFSKLPDGAKKTQLAMDFLGRSGSNLIPMLSMNRWELEKLFNEFERTGKSIDAVTIKLGKELQDSFVELKTSVQGLAFSFIKELLPTIKEFTSRITSLVQWFNKLDPVTKQLISTTGILSGIFTAIAGSVLLLTIKIIDLHTKLKALEGITAFKFLTSGLGAVALALAAAGYQVGAIIKGMYDATQATGDLSKSTTELTRQYEANWKAMDDLKFAAQHGIIDPFERMKIPLNEASQAVKEYQDRIDALRISLGEYYKFNIESFIESLTNIQKEIRVLDLEANAKKVAIKLGLDLAKIDNWSTEQKREFIEALEKSTVKTQESIPVIKTLTEQYIEATDKLIDYNALLEQTASSLGLTTEFSKLSREELLRLAGVYEDLVGQAETSTEAWKVIYAALEKMQDGLRLTREEVDKLRDAMREAGVDMVGYVRQLNNITDTTKQTARATKEATDEMNNGFVIVGQTLNTLGAELFETLMEGSKGFENFGQIAIRTIKRLIAEIMTAIIVGNVLKAMRLNVGGMGGWYSVFFDNPINDARMMLAGFKQGIPQQGIDMQRQFNDINRYYELGSGGQRQQTIAPKVEVIIESPPGAFVRSIRQVPERDLHTVEQETFGRVRKLREIL